MADRTAPERWEAAQRIFHGALAREPAARAAFVAASAGGDRELAREVESLLAAHQRDSVLDLAEPRPRVGPTPALGQIGPYRLLRPLGEGGMGTVYLAERAGGDFTQLVALKLLRAGFVDPRLDAQLRAERRLLARLEHPGIARLIDGGATPTGQPYYVMEYVEGTNLLAYCAQARLGVRERIRLFLEVCDAVHYAHQQLVVHRDLKPGNVLVTTAGRAKLLDFGIAKALDPEGGAEDATTVPRTTPWFTPAYASPEQIRGRRIGTLTDVYALGVMLCELLTGRRPHAVEAAISPIELERLVCEGEPLRPSAAAVGPEEAAARGATPAQLRRRLTGDLDTIVLKAIAVEPARRYASVDRFAGDLRRFLAGEPVQARPDTFRYRASKFARRHRVAVTSAALLLVALVIGVAATTWQAAVARRERDRAERALAVSEDVTGFLIDLFEASAPERARADTAAAREILRRGVARIDELAAQPLIQARMLDALGMVFVSLGRYDRAHEMIARGLRLRLGALDSLHPDVGESYRLLGRTLRARARYPQALEALRTALDITRRARGADHPAVARILSDLGFLMPYLGRNDESARYYREALALRRRAHGDESEAVAEALLDVAAVERRLRLHVDAAAHAREAIATLTRLLGPEHVEVANAMVALGDVLAGDPATHADAEGLFRDATAIQRRALGDRDLELVHGLNSLADLLMARRENLGEAERLQREILAINLELLGPEHPAVGASYDGVAAVLEVRGRLDEALALRRRGLEIWRGAVGAEHAAVAGSLSGLARLHRTRGEYAEAEALWRESAAMRTRLHGPTHPLVGIGLSELGAILTLRGAYAEAERTLLSATAILDSVQPVGHPDRREAHRNLAELYRATGRLEEAARQDRLARP